MAELTRKEVIKLIAVVGQPSQGVRLTGVDLSGLDLSRLNFRHAGTVKTTVKVIDIDDTVEVALRRCTSSGHTRLPVTEERLKEFVRFGSSRASWDLLQAI